MLNRLIKKCLVLGAALFVLREICKRANILAGHDERTAKEPDVKKSDVLDGEITAQARYADEKQHRKYEKAYWDQSLRLTIAAFVIAVVAALASGGALIQAWRQANVSERAQRPWIKIDGLKVSQLVITKENVATDYDLQVKNVGNELAREIVIIPDEPRIYLGEDVPVDYLKRFCETQISSDGFTFFGNAIFPQEQTRLRVATSRKKESFRRALKKFADVIADGLKKRGRYRSGLEDNITKIVNSINFIFGGCATYKAASVANEQHYTSCAYIIKYPISSTDGDIVVGRGFDLDFTTEYKSSKDFAVEPVLFETYVK